MAKKPRVPLAARADLMGTERIIQVNHCRQPACENFGLPAQHEPQKPGPSEGRDPRYKLHSTSKGQIPSIKCKSCGENPPVKSNESIVREIERLAESGSLWRPEEVASCPNETCANHGRPVAKHARPVARRGESAYVKIGKPSHGRGQQYRCESCGRKFSITKPVRLHDRNRRLAADLFSRIANKSPARCAIRGADVRSTQSYYTMIRFIHDQCRFLSGAVDRAFIDGSLRLPESLVTETDAQEYTLNWTSRLDRRNVVFSGYATVDSSSRFMLGMHVNFDARVDPFEVNRDAALRGDFELAEAFRKYAHYWLSGDELMAGRAMGAKMERHQRIELMEQIRILYRNAKVRRDVEDIEMAVHDPRLRQIPPLKYGIQVHEPYTAYAHWMLVRQMLAGAGVKRVQANMDKSSMSRAAFLCAFADEVRSGAADAFYVRYTKYQTIDEREGILAESRRRRAKFRASLPDDLGVDMNDRKAVDREVARRMMRAWIKAGQTYGQWEDVWIEHPVPTINEPHKAMSWVTVREGIDEERKIDMFLNAGLARIDNVFMKSRRLCNAIERPVGASSSHNTVWHGYAPYNPQMLECHLGIFRTVHNFVFVGDDGKTPAMRLGVANEPLRYEDILWPGERVPRPKRVRRKGRVISL